MANERYDQCAIIYSTTKEVSGHFRLIFFIVSKVKPIKTRLLVSVLIIIGGLANLTIWNPFDEYLVRFIEGLRNIDFDHHSRVSVGEEKRYVLEIE